MAMLGDGIQSYNNDKDGSDNELAGCEVIHANIK
jgi:mannose-binding lectin 2